MVGGSRGRFRVWGGPIQHASRRQSGTEQRESVAMEARCAFSLAVACVFWRMRDVPSLQS